MMSVPAINPVLPSSGNQPPKVASGPAANTVTPIGLAVSQKVSVIPSQISTSPSKPSLSVNHSAGPLSLVHENKISGAQAQIALAKTDKPKDLSPAKPTSNGVEASKTSPTESPQPEDGAPPAETKPEEKPAEQPVVNHAENTTEEPPVIEAQKEEAQNVLNSNSEADQNVNQTQSESNSEPKVNTTAEIAESGTTETKPVKLSPAPNKRKREQPKGEEKKTDEPVPEKKPQRIRSQVLPYQSPLPELATFINKSLKEKDASQKSGDEKLIVFYKNEFLAVRNAENGFYLCQTLQNVYRTSHRIRIRWLSQDKESNTVYTPDFYDLTDFECILTTVALEKMEKNKYKLPLIELERTENILKRALDVEKGVSEKPPVTEEHPDGSNGDSCVDLSLYKDESQLQKPKKRKAASLAKKSPKQTKSEKAETEEGGEEAAEEPKKKKSKTKPKGVKKTKKATKAKAKAGKKGKSETSAGRDKSSRNVDQLKVSPPNEKARVVAKVLRKVEVTTTTSKKSKSKGKATKSNSKKSERKSTKSEKSTASSRSSDRRVSTATSRKKSGKK